MFTIIISEKGGAERRETFDKNEINVGRVQGNDLMLPKGNVSKHHARLLYRDGRFIVTDLKSTNGTYVNGRKIAQATIVREGDKIYIGDFVLRLDTGGASLPTGDADASYRPEEPVARPPRIEAPSRPNAPPIATAKSEQAGVSHYPLERDPDEADATGAPVAPADRSGPAPVASPAAPAARSQPGPAARAAAMPVVTPGSPAAGSQPQGGPAPLRGASTAIMGSGGQIAPRASARAPQAAPSVPPTRDGGTAPPAPSPPGSLNVGPAATANPNAGPMASSEARYPSRMPPRETPAQAGRRLALITLVDRVADVLDMGPLKSSPIVDEAFSQQVERTIREQVKSMRDEGEAPEGVDVELLARDAHRELVGLGPVGPLLEDDDVTEIHVMRHDQVIATKGGAVSLADSSFTTDDALYRVIARLVHQTGQPWQADELVVERRLARGARMIAMSPPVASGYTLVIRKRRRVESSLEELIRGGALSRPMAVFLEHCVVGRANVLVCGSHGRGATGFLGALASLAPPADRIAVLHDDEEIGLVQPYAVSLTLPDSRQRGEEVVRAAARLHLDRMFVSSIAGHVAASVVEAIAEGAEGVVASLAAPSLRQGLSRLVAQMMLARPGLGVEGARECVGESFDVAVELARGNDGRPRVMRIAELAGSDAKGVVARDLFALAENGAAGEAAYVSTGVVPRFTSELASRGVRVDPNLFKRTLGRGA